LAAGILFLALMAGPLTVYGRLVVDGRLAAGGPLISEPAR
jgi:hypothetical protein